MLYVVAALVTYTPHVEISSLTVVRTLYRTDAWHTSVAIARVWVLAFEEHHRRSLTVDVGRPCLLAAASSEELACVSFAVLDVVLPAHSVPFPLEHIVVELHALVDLVAV